MVLSGIMITPFALLWITPGLAARILYPAPREAGDGRPDPDRAPAPRSGSSDFVIGRVPGLGAVDDRLEPERGRDAHVQRHLRPFHQPESTPKQLLRAVRVATVFAGLLMIGVTYLVPYLGGAVDAYLTIISIMDMPLFVIAIPFGLLWKKTTWQGAMAGYLAGSATGAVLRFGFNVDVAPVTLISGAVAAFVCPAVSLLTQRTGGGGGLRLKELFAAAKASEETLAAASPLGKTIGAWVLGAGFAVFLGRGPHGRPLDELRCRGSRRRNGRLFPRRGHSGQIALTSLNGPADGRGEVLVLAADLVGDVAAELVEERLDVRRARRPIPPA